MKLNTLKSIYFCLLFWKKLSWQTKYKTKLLDKWFSAMKVKDRIRKFPKDKKKKKLKKKKKKCKIKKIKELGCKVSVFSYEQKQIWGEITCKWNIKR